MLPTNLQPSTRINEINIHPRVQLVRDELIKQSILEKQSATTKVEFIDCNIAHLAGFYWEFDIHLRLFCDNHEENINVVHRRVIKMSEFMSVVVFDESGGIEKVIGPIDSLLAAEKIARQFYRSRMDSTDNYMLPNGTYVTIDNKPVCVVTRMDYENYTQLIRN